MMGLVKKNEQPTVTTETISSEQNYCKNFVGIKERFLVRRQNPLDFYQHHHNSYTPRGRSKVSSRIKSSPIDDNLISTKDDQQTKNIGRKNRIKTTTTATTKSDQQNGNSQIGINLELNLPGENNNFKRIKRSLSSTRLEKEKSDEKNTKLLRKNQTNDKVQNSVLQKPSSTTTTVATSTATSLPLRKLNSGSLNKSDYSVLKLRKR